MSVRLALPSAAPAYLLEIAAVAAQLDPLAVRAQVRVDPVVRLDQLEQRPLDVVRLVGHGGGVGQERERRHHVLHFADGGLAKELDLACHVESGRTTDSPEVPLVDEVADAQRLGHRLDTDHPARLQVVGTEPRDEQHAEHGEHRGVELRDPAKRLERPELTRECRQQLGPEHKGRAHVLVLPGL